MIISWNRVFCYCVMKELLLVKSFAVHLYALMHMYFLRVLLSFVLTLPVNMVWNFSSVLSKEWRRWELVQFWKGFIGSARLVIRIYWKFCRCRYNRSLNFVVLVNPRTLNLPEHLILFIKPHIEWVILYVPTIHHFIVDSKNSPWQCPYYMYVVTPLPWPVCCGMVLHSYCGHFSKFAVCSQKSCHHITLLTFITVCTPTYM